MREELRFPNYERVRVHNEKDYWQKSGLDFQPKIILQLDAAMLNPKLVLKVRAKQSLGKVRSHGKDGIRDKCIEVKSKTSTDKILCFDEGSGNLVGVEYSKNDNESPPEITRVAYGAFHDVGEKHVPFEIRAFSDKMVFATVKVVEIKPIAEENPSAFVVPVNSEFWAQCKEMQDCRVGKSRSAAVPGKRTFESSNRNRHLLCGS